MKDWIVHLTMLSVEAEDEDDAVKQAEEMIKNREIEIGGVEKA